MRLSYYRRLVEEEKQILVRPFWLYFSTCRAGMQRVSASTFCLRPDTAKVKGKILVKEWGTKSQCSLPFQTTHLRSWRSHVVQSFESLVNLSCFTNTEHKYGG